jgi:steroid delta-isomerase-like uncharacterized protein
MSTFDSVGSISRRAVVVRLGVGGGFGLAAAARGLPVLAQDATPKAARAALPPAVARFVAAMEAADADALAASYAPNGVLEEVGFGQTFTGRDAIREDEATFLAEFSDVTLQIPNAFACDDWAAIEFAFRGTYTGQLSGMPPGAGQTVSFRGASILHIGSEGIERHTQYFDAYSILVQLGALPAPDGAEREASPAASPSA